MAHAPGLLTVAEALQRLFVPRRAHRALNSPWRASSCRCLSSQPQPGGFKSDSSVVYRPMGSSPPAASIPRLFGPKDSQLYLRDEAIESRFVRLVNDSGIQEPQALASVLRSFDRQTYFLIQVSKPAPDEYPVCKIVDKAAYRSEQKAKGKATKQAAVTPKTLELGWAIGPNDLNHRMNKMAQFLEEGRKVDVLVARKKKARPVTEEEAWNVVRGIRERLKSVEGAREWKPMEGVVGKQVSLYVEGKPRRAGEPEAEDSTGSEQAIHP